MENFSQEFSAWQPFFTTLTVLSATLAGLLFVALSLHATALRMEENANLRRLASHTFGNFVTILFIGLFFIVPKVTSGFLGVSTLIIVMIGLRHLMERFLQVFRDRDNILYRRYFFTRLGLSLLAQLLLLAGAIGLLLQSTYSGNLSGDMLFIFSGSAMMLVAAMSNSWYLLAHELG